MNPRNLSESDGFEILNIVGDYAELSVLLGRKLNVEGHSQSILDELKKHCNYLKEQNKFAVLSLILLKEKSFN